MLLCAMVQVFHTTVYIHTTWYVFHTFVCFHTAWLCFHTGELYNFIPKWLDSHLKQIYSNRNWSIIPLDVKITLNLRLMRTTQMSWRGGKGPVMKICSPYPRLFFYSYLGLLPHDGVDSCVFFIFTTRVDPNKRNQHQFRLTSHPNFLKKEV